MHAQLLRWPSSPHADHAIVHGMADSDAVRLFLALARAKTAARGGPGPPLRPSRIGRSPRPPADTRRVRALRVQGLPRAAPPTRARSWVRRARRGPLRGGLPRVAGVHVAHATTPRRARYRPSEQHAVTG